jgi:spore cortex biosynthesis protein YabQ
VSIAVQLQTVAFMSLCGVLMGIGFDTYHVFKGKGRFPPWLVFIFDLLFWLLSIGLVFFVLIRVNDGIVRFPIFIGIFAGAWFYFLVGSKKYIQFLLGVIKFCKWLYKTVLMIIEMFIVRPVFFLYKLVWMLLAFLFSIVTTILAFLWKVVRFLASPFGRWSHHLGKRIHSKGKGFWTSVKKWVQAKKKQ